MRLVEKLREIKKATPQANVSKLVNNSKSNRNTMNFAIVEFINKYNKAVNATATAAQAVNLFPRRNGANNLSVRRAENAIRQANQAARQVAQQAQTPYDPNEPLRTAAKRVQNFATRPPPPVPPRPAQRAPPPLPPKPAANLINLSNGAPAPATNVGAGLNTNQLIGRLQTGSNAQKKDALNKLSKNLSQNPFLEGNNRSKIEKAIIQRYLELLGTNQRNNAYNKLRSFLNSQNTSPNMKTNINKGIANTLIKLARQKNNAWAGGKIMNLYKDPEKSRYLPREISNFILKPVARTANDRPVYFKNGKYYAKNGNKIYEAVLNANGVYRINNTKRQAYYKWTPTGGFQQVQF